MKVTGANATAGIFGTLPAQGVSQVSLFFDQVVSTAILLISVCALSNKRNKLVSNSQIPLAVGFVIVAIGVAFGKRKTNKKLLHIVSCLFSKVITVVSLSILLVISVLVFSLSVLVTDPKFSLLAIIISGYLALVQSSVRL